MAENATSTGTPDEVAQRVVAAYHDARDALMRLSNTIFDLRPSLAEDHAIHVAYAIAYSPENVDNDGIPLGLLDATRDGDRLLTLASDCRKQLTELVELSHAVPSDYDPNSPEAIKVRAEFNKLFGEDTENTGK